MIVTFEMAGTNSNAKVANCFYQLFAVFGGGLAKFVKCKLGLNWRTVA